MKKPVKPKKKSSKMPKKPKKQGFSDAIKAFFLVGAIVAFSALISFAIIMIHSLLNNDKNISQEQINDFNQFNLDAGTISSKENLNNIDPLTSIIKTDSKPETSISENILKPAEQKTNQVRNNYSGSSSSVTATPSTSTAVTASSVVVPLPPEKPIQNLGTLVFVIDDAGNNLRDLEPFLNIPGPLTIAVLPGLPHSAEAAKRIRAVGKEVILHQPMEAIGGQNPGPGAIFSNMSELEIREVLARNIAEVGPVNGINNHQGSKITMEKQTMQVILSFCKENNLYFLDSRTTSDSVASEVARQVGIKFTERNVFIDNEQNKDAMLRYIGNGLTRAQRNGSAVMIGHTWSPELAPLLKEQFPLLTGQGYTIKTAFDIVK